MSPNQHNQDDSQLSCQFCLAGRNPSILRWSNAQHRCSEGLICSSWCSLLLHNCNFILYNIQRGVAQQPLACQISSDIFNYMILSQEGFVSFFFFNQPSVITVPLQLRSTLLASSTLMNADLFNYLFENQKMNTFQIKLPSLHSLLPEVLAHCLYMFAFQFSFLMPTITLTQNHFFRFVTRLQHNIKRHYLVQNVFQ